MSSTLIIDNSAIIPILEISTPFNVILEISTPGPKGDTGETGDTGDTGPSGVTVVTHGTNPNVARPASPVVYWVGTADPVNALAYDWWDNS